MFWNSLGKVDLAVHYFYIYINLVSKAHDGHHTDEAQISILANRLRIDINLKSGKEQKKLFARVHKRSWNPVYMFSDQYLWLYK